MTARGIANQHSIVYF